MNTLFIQNGFIKRFSLEQSKKSLAGMFNLDRWLSESLNAKQVGFVDPCCPNLATYTPTHIPKGAEQSISGDGAANVTSYSTKWTSTSTDDLTLADGVNIGQLKKISMVVDGGDGVLTPDTFVDYSTVTFNDAGDFVVLVWTKDGWQVIESSGVILT